MINVGCDVGKNNFDIYFFGKHKKFLNNSEGIDKFLAMCSGKTDIRVILEPTGGYEKKLVNKLFETKTPVSIVNPYCVRNFARSYKDMAKTDIIDSRILSEYGEKMNPRATERVEKWRVELEELTNRRDILVEISKEEKLRLEKEPSDKIKRGISNHLKFHEKSIKSLEGEIKEQVEKHAKSEAEILQSENKPRRFC